VKAVIPGPAEGRSPESIATNLSDQITTGEYGFRARRFAAPRNDGVRVAPLPARLSGLVEPVQGVEGPHREFGERAVDQQ
jgi:hypothetical protein